MFKYLMPLALIILSITISCSSLENDWYKAKQINTIEAYKDFLEKHKDSPFADSAKINLRTLDYANAKETNSVELLSDYINKYPNAPENEIIEATLDSLFYEKALSYGTIESYEKFLTSCPNSPRSEIIKDSLAVLIYRNINDTTSNEELERLIDNYPNSSIVADVKKLLSHRKTEKLAMINYLNIQTEKKNSALAKIENIENYSIGTTKGPQEIISGGGLPGFGKMFPNKILNPEEGEIFAILEITFNPKENFTMSVSSNSRYLNNVRFINASYEAAAIAEKFSKKDKWDSGRFSPSANYIFQKGNKRTHYFLFLIKEGKIKNSYIDFNGLIFPCS
jgi:hypothetical protein